MNALRWYNFPGSSHSDIVKQNDDMDDLVSGILVYKEGSSINLVAHEQHQLNLN